MVHNFDAAQIGPFALGRFANSCLVAKQSYVRDPIARAHRCRYDRARIVSLRQHDMLELGGCALANSFKDVHRKKESVPGFE